MGHSVDENTLKLVENLVARRLLDPYECLGTIKGHDLKNGDRVLQMCEKHISYV